MPVAKLFEPLSFLRGPAMKNRFMLAPLTNRQSHPDGRLSREEFRWLAMRAEGGFGFTMTCASHVQSRGQGFAGQLGIFGDEHIEALAPLAAAIKSNGSVAAVQLHHAGNRADKTLVGDIVCPSDDPATGARGLTQAEVEGLRDDFIAAARRAEEAGFDGVELHGAHGYMLLEFLSPKLNRRDDRYGGSLENRSRIIFEIIDGIRTLCREDFQIGLRLSPERFGVKLPEIRDVAIEVLRQEQIDYLDMSLWDYTIESADEAFKGRSLMNIFTSLPRGIVRLGVAGKIRNAQDVVNVIEGGCDYALIGRAAILAHDFPERVRADANYVSPPLPVSPDYLQREGISPKFVEYLRTFPGFVSADAPAMAHDEVMKMWMKMDG